MGFKFVQVEEKGKQTVEYEFQINETNSAEHSCYSIIIDNDLLWNMGIDIWYTNQTIEWDRNKIILQIDKTLSDPDKCDILIYRIHTDSPIIKEVEEQTAKALEANYSKVYIDKMVNKLDISTST